MVINVIVSSEDRAEVRMTGEILDATNSLKDYMYANVYNRDMRGNVELSKAMHLLKELFRLYMQQPQSAPQSLLAGQPRDLFLCLPLTERAVRVTDFIAGMTDRYATEMFRQQFVPEAWSN